MAQTKPKIKSTSDRKFLDKVRSQLGSSFNLIASQFEDVDVLVFTESKYDFSVISSFARALGMKKRAFNVPLNGFSEYKKAVLYKEAYEKFFGKHVHYSVFLDQDYYPTEYLEEVREELRKHSIQVVFTPGKETENLLLDRKLLLSLVPQDDGQNFQAFIDKLFNSEYNESLGSLITLHTQFPSTSKKAAKTVLSQQKPGFDEQWYHPENRFGIIGGKNALAAIRGFFKQSYGINLPTQFLVQSLVNSPKRELITKLTKDIYQM